MSLANTQRYLGDIAVKGVLASLHSKANVGLKLRQSFSVGILSLAHITHPRRLRTKPKLDPEFISGASCRAFTYFMFAKRC